MSLDPVEAVASHLPSVLALVAAVVFVVRLEQSTRSQAVAMKEHAERMKEGFDGVTERLDRLNGQVYDHAQRIARCEGQAHTPQHQRMATS